MQIPLFGGVALGEQWLGTVGTDLERVVYTDPQSAIGRPTKLSSSHPFRDDLWATALYRVEPKHTSTVGASRVSCTPTRCRRRLFGIVQ